MGLRNHATIERLSRENDALRAEAERLQEAVCRVRNVWRQSNGMVLPSDIIAEIEASGHFPCPHDKEVERLKERNALLLAVAEKARDCMNDSSEHWGDANFTEVEVALDAAHKGGAMP